MALIDTEQWAALSTNAVTGTDAVAADALCAAVSDAITRLCYPNILEPVTFTLQAFDAPLSPVLVLPAPVRSITAIYVVPFANGDNSQCDATNLLTNYTDYYLDISDKVAGISRTGRVYIRSRTVWGFERRWPIGTLASALDPNRASVFVSASMGPASVSPAVQLAASTAVSMLFSRRKSGVPLNNESWGGYSYGNSSQFTMTDAINSPEVQGLLTTAGVLPFHVGGL